MWSVSCNQNNTWLECSQFLLLFTSPVLILCSICIEARKKCEGNADQKERELKQFFFRPKNKQNKEKQEWPRDSQMKPKAAAAQAAVRCALKILRIKTFYRQPAQGTIWIIRQWRRVRNNWFVDCQRTDSSAELVDRGNLQRAVSCRTTRYAVLHQIRCTLNLSGFGSRLMKLGQIS